MFISWLCAGFYQAVLLGLMVISAFRTGIHGGRLLRTIYYDGIFFYLYILTLTLLNVLVILLAPIELLNLIGPHERVIHSVLTSRAILHIRRSFTNPAYSTISEQFSISSTPDPRATQI
ncbi:hypothetical protein D9758_009466 [Tetrapyrgos nigripes]|uniref:Uncharacterized protein n=1 Tax=Tetrapyrgos nigripes TaxID=182062 RepID=A0A8H5LGD9_9AGAR|nr:hypothetical protein D9758_009466 [Tetrapyrgos nigripes]